MVATLMKDAFTANIEGWGSNGTFYMMMPRNNFSFGTTTDVPFPCIVDDDLDIDESDRRLLLQKANNYEKVLPYDAPPFKDITIDRGEVPAGAINESGTEAQFIRLHATTDSRIVEFQDMTSRFTRNIIQWRFPMDHIVTAGPDRKDRKRLWIWGMLAGGEKGQKNAYIIESSLDVFKMQIVDYRRGPKDTLLVDKAGSSEPKDIDQVQKPGTLGLVPDVNSNVSGLATTVQPPAPEKATREPTIIVESRDGKLEPEQPKVKSDSNEETNNTVANKDLTDEQKKKVEPND
jgi:hypothetical protein